MEVLSVLVMNNTIINKFLMQNFSSQKFLLPLLSIRLEALSFLKSMTFIFKLHVSLSCYYLHFIEKLVSLSHWLPGQETLKSIFYVKDFSGYYLNSLKFLKIYLNSGIKHKINYHTSKIVSFFIQYWVFHNKIKILKTFKLLFDKE